MFPSEQRKSHNSNNKRLHSEVVLVSKRVLIPSKKTIRKCKCWWPPPVQSTRIKSILPICLHLLGLIYYTSILILFIVNSVESADQPMLSSSSSPQLPPRHAVSSLVDQHLAESRHIERSRLKLRSPRSSEQNEPSKTRSVSSSSSSEKRSKQQQQQQRQRHQDGASKPSLNTDQLTFRDSQSGNNQSLLARPSSTRPHSTGHQTNGVPSNQWLPMTRQQARNTSVTQSRQVSPAPQQRSTEAIRTNLANNRHHHQRNANSEHNLQPVESYNHHIRHMQHQQQRRRRPRFNEEPMATASSTTSRLYRRVLICDKTLVSLDYLRHSKSSNYQWHRRRPTDSGHLPGPLISGEFELSDFADDFEDNSIDSEGNAHLLMVESRNEPLVQSNTTTTTMTTTTTASNASDIDGSSIERMAHMSSFNYHHHQPPPLPAHLLLSDEDPLVRCDMWDLEKGLKNRAPPEFLVRQAVRADFETVREAINRCRQLSERTYVPPGGGAIVSDDYYRDHTLEIMSTEDLLSLFSMKRGLMPGTKWCGLGDQAATYNDLGPKYRIDICCRAHDHCPIRSKPFRNDYGVLNIGLYTKSHCDCDADFYRCLREVRSRTADLLGNLYFNVMKLQCMREEKMKICREMKPISLLGIERCSKFEESPFRTVFKFTTPPVAY